MIFSVFFGARILDIDIPLWCRCTKLEFSKTAQTYSERSLQDNWFYCLDLRRNLMYDRDPFGAG